MNSVTDENFQEEVLESNKPIILYVWATWCSSCNTIGPIVDELAEELDYLKVVKLDFDTGPISIEALDVNRLPVLMAIDNGEILARRSGLRSKEQIKKWVETHFKYLS